MRLSSSQIYPAGEPALRTRVVVLASGLRARAVEGGPEHGPPVVLLPGWGGSAYLFRKNVPALAAAGYRAISLDLKGHGLSDKPRDPAEYTLASMTRFVIEAMDALHLPRAALVGQSMGGAIAAQVALDQPPRVDRLALLSSVGYGRVRGVSFMRWVSPSVVRPFLRLITHRCLFAAVLRSVYGENARPTSRDVDEYYAPTVDPAFVPALHSLIVRFSWHSYEDGRLRALRAPLLALVGEQDPVVQPNALECFGRDVAGAVTVHLPGVGHMPQEEAPARVNAELLAFLGAHAEETGTAARAIG